MSRQGLRMAVVVSLVSLILGGCATTAQKISESDFPRYMAESNVKVDQLLKENKRDEAVGVLEKLSGQNPVRKEPWSRLARIYFDAGDYGHAIVSASEVLQRDPQDRTAKSIQAVSGLRVATAALYDLRDDTEMTGSARVDAVNLAKVLRETLGESVLVPPPSQKEVEAQQRAAEEAKARARRRVVRRQVKDAVSAAGASQGTAAPSAPSTVNGDPFSILK